MIGYTDLLTTHSDLPAPIISRCQSDVLIIEMDNKQTGLIIFITSIFPTACRSVE